MEVTGLAKSLPLYLNQGAELAILIHEVLPLSKLKVKVKSDHLGFYFMSTGQMYDGSFSYLNAYMSADFHNKLVSLLYEKTVRVDFGILHLWETNCSPSPCVSNSHKVTQPKTSC